RTPRAGNGKGDDGQHAGKADAIGENPYAEGADELHDDGNRHIANGGDKTDQKAREQDADGDAADDDGDGRGHDAGDWEVAGDGGADGEAIDEQGGRIVHETLAFENGADAVRQLDLAHDGGGRRGVGWRDNGAERDGDAPRHVRNEPAGHERDRRGGHSDRRDREAGDRHPIALQVTQREIVRGIEQHRRDEQSERELRI